MMSASWAKHLKRFSSRQIGEVKGRSNLWRRESRLTTNYDLCMASAFAERGVHLKLADANWRRVKENARDGRVGDEP
jgi:hypothetical protein